MRIIVGLCGYAGVGKDTLAHTLQKVSRLGWQRVAFADALKDFAYKIGSSNLRTSVDQFGWDETKRNMAHREYLQTLGVAARETFGENCWADLAFRKIQADGYYVFTDVRFSNEAQRIKSNGGYLVRIDRPFVGPVNSHVSDNGWTDWTFDWHLYNTGTPEDLARLMLSCLSM